MQFQLRAIRKTRGAAAFYEDAMRRVRALAGVKSVALSMAVPPHRLVMTNPYTPEGKVYASGESAPVAQQLMVSPDFFQVMGLPMREGRAFTDADRNDSERVIIVNEAFARKSFPDGKALGRWVQTGAPNPAANKNIIVGIVPDVRYAGMESLPEPTIYQPFKQASWWRSMYMIVHTTGDPLAYVDRVRAEITSIDPLLALQEVTTMEIS